MAEQDEGYLDANPVAVARSLRFADFHLRQALSRMDASSALFNNASTATRDVGILRMQAQSALEGVGKDGTSA